MESTQPIVTEILYARKNDSTALSHGCVVQFRTATGKIVSVNNNNHLTVNLQKLLASLEYEFRRYRTNEPVSITLFRLDSGPSYQVTPFSSPIKTKNQHPLDSEKIKLSVEYRLTFTPCEFVEEKFTAIGQSLAVWEQLTLSGESSETERMTAIQTAIRALSQPLRLTALSKVKDDSACSVRSPTKGKTFSARSELRRDQKTAQNGLVNELEQARQQVLEVSQQCEERLAIQKRFYETRIQLLSWRESNPTLEQQLCQTKANADKYLDLSVQYCRAAENAKQQAEEANDKLNRVKQEIQATEQRATKAESEAKAAREETSQSNARSQQAELVARRSQLVAILSMLLAAGLAIRLWQAGSTAAVAISPQNYLL